MQHVTIPKTSLNVSVVCLGTADMGTKISRDESIRILDAYLDSGGNFIDTASVYSDWVPGEKSRVEKLLGEWMSVRRNRDSIILATKGAHPELATMTLSRMSRKDIEHDLNASLRNLRTDVIDLYWLHRDAPDHPVADILETLSDQVKAGKIRYFGCSNWRLARIKAANDYALKQGVRGFIANQPMWNLAYVPQERLSDQTCVVMDEAMRQWHRENGLGCVPWSSQANGFFQHAANGTLVKMHPVHQRLYGEPENAQRSDRVQQLATQTGMSVTEIVLAYLLSQSFPVFPIIGCRNVEQLQDSLRASGKRLITEQVRFLESGI